MLGKKSTRRRWTQAELDYVKQNSETMKDEDMATALNRTLKGVREQRRRLNIIKKSGRGVVALKDSE
jgi:hypothetical protein